ncbi:MAG: S1/P1 nuclease [Flavisolibacter sp.]
MKRGYSRIIFSFVFLLYLPLHSFAWGMLGHRIVAQIAESYLTAKARVEIQKILGNESMAIAANWADFIKSDTSFKYLSPWHYADFPKDLNYSQLKDVLKADTTADAYTKTVFLVSELKKKSLPMEKKKMYLRLLIHIVGDIHQPLHVSPEGTSGGNDVHLSWFGAASNLHRVWDDQLIDYQQLSYTEYTNAINHTTLSQRKAWQKQPLSQWFFDSYTISQQLHQELKDPNPKLSYRYNFDHIATLNEQLLKGGVHLAGLLNEIFGS